MPESAKITRIIPAGTQPALPPAPPPGPPAVPPPPAAPPHAATAAGGAGGWLWDLPPAPPVPPGGGRMTPWQPPQPPTPSQPQRIDLHVTVHRPVQVEPDLTWWQRLARAVPYRVSPLVAVTATAAAIVPLPHLGYGVGRMWGSLLDHFGTDVHPTLSHIAAVGAIAVVAARIHRPCRIAPTLDGGWVRRLNWLDAFGVAITFIGGCWGVLVPDIVAATTGVRA
ncbi:hypothetical protein [Streptomyces decoyicus]